MIKHLLITALTGGIACVLALILTPIVREIMRKIGAIDLPDPRRVNKIPVPRGGGHAVVLSFFGALAIAYFLWPNALLGDHFASVFPWFVLSTVILVAVGFWDDLRGMPAVLKLGAQILVAGLMCWGGARLMLPTALGDWVLSPWVYVPLTIGWYVGVVNAFNLIDGLDGLSSGLAIIATLGMMGVSLFIDPTAGTFVSCAFIGALLGFLRYNYNPASVFMGDSGSLFVGLTLATMALVTRRGDAFLVSIGIPILCIGVPLIDTSLAIIRRTLRYFINRDASGGAAGATMVADRDHIHHRFLNMAKGNQRRAVWGLYGLASALVVLGFITLSLRESKAAIFLLGFVAFAWVIVRAMTNVELWDAGRILSKPGARNGRRAISVPYYVVADLGVMAVLHLFLILLLDRYLPTYIAPTTWLNLFLAYVVPVGVCLAIFKAYTRIWGRSVAIEGAMVVIAIGIGSCISHIALSYTVTDLARMVRLHHLLWSLILPMLLLGVRLAKTLFLQYLAYSENHHLLKASEKNDSIERILFYGAGVSLRAYLILYTVNVTRNRDALVGVLDDNLGLRGRSFAGMSILGPLEVLEDEEILTELRPTKILLTTPAIGEERLAEIRAFCEPRGIAIDRFITDEVNILPKSNPSTQA